MFVVLMLRMLDSTDDHSLGPTTLKLFDAILKLNLFNLISRWSRQSKATPLCNCNERDFQGFVVIIIINYKPYVIVN